jgi:RHS repeat-associated protein
MKRALLAVPLLVAVFAWFARGAYTYYYTENGASPVWSNWTVESTGGGNLVSQWYSAGGFGGITASDVNTWGRMTYPSTSASPGEIKLTYRMGNLSLSGGSAIVYFGASSDFSFSNQSAGSAYQLTLGYASSGSYYWLYKIVNGSSTQLSFGAVAGAGHDNMTLRVVRHSNGLILAYLDNVRFLDYSDTSLTGGRMAFYVYRPDSTLANDPLISEVDLGHLDSTPPNAISSGSIGVSAFSNHVDLQWPAGTDDTNGSGVYDYEIYRNGGLVGTTTGLTFSDASVSPHTAYTYTLNVVDFHGNATGTNFNVTTPAVQTTGPFPSATPEGRRVGVRATGAYWGASGENIDVRSSNLNFTLPLISAKARNGWGVNFALSYNSQNWRHDSGGNWKFANDVGYGWGWRLMAGSITPVYSDPYTVSYYLFTDSTGAEYRLDQNSSNVWSSKESVYVYYDANASRLYFRDGSFWYLGCTSAASEADSGVLYPTLMEDSNGNQIIVHYMTAPGAGWTNSSARISAIEDVRTPGTNAYVFNYNTDSPPHLTGTTVYVPTGENYTFNYLSGQALSSPFDSQSYGTTTMLQSVVVNANYTDHEFTYNGSGELTKIVLPYKGYLSYDYTTVSYSGAVVRSYREVVRRYLSKDGIATTQYSFSHEPSPSGDVHQYTVLDDPGGVGEKYWSFATSGLAEGLVTQYQGRQLPGPVTKIQNDYTWAQDAVSNSYIQTALVTADPGQSYAAQKKTTQIVDTHGNVTQVNTYDYGNLTTPMRTDNFTYLTGYESRYIFNRMVTSPTTTITYDQYSLASLSGVYEWDSSMQSVTTRGNPTTVVSSGGTQSMHYDIAGGVSNTTVNGVTTTATTTSTTNYAAPSQITVGSLSTSMSYNSFLGLTNETDPNGAQVSIGYDALARPGSTTSPFGATTTITYNDTSSPPTANTTINNGRWTRTSMDGLGRTAKVETGYGTTTVSVAETEYDSCGCSPLGKMKRTALPHAPGATQVWTTYTYDGIGRTLTTSTVGTETTSTTSYSYQGNTVTVTDAAGNWKKYTTDALGQLIQVNEPNPAGGSDYVTTYAYDSLGHLTSVSMPRPSGTQTRTFNYGTPAGAQLLSATNPENGTVTYTYNSDKTLATKTDSKNQQVQYSYDSYKRVTQIRRGTYNGTFTEDTCQQENYSYDTNPYDGTFSGSYTLGRLVAVQYKSLGGFVGSAGGCNTTFTEMYSYSQAGGVLKKRLRITRMVDNYNSQNADLDAVYTYDTEGRMTATQYPTYWSIDSGNVGSWKPGPTLGVTYDSMGHLQKLTDVGASSDIVSNASYNPAGQLLTTTGVNGAPSETRTYNSIGQMTQLQSGSLNLQYAYSATQNNGKITAETDVVSGEQITYAYDSLNRLASATSSLTPGWGQSYAYDGFGNLTNQTVTKGTAPSLSTSYDPATNRQTGECADANGNINSATNCTNGNYFDVENRLVRNSALTWAYSYAPGNKRVWRGVWSGGTQTVDEVVFWGVNGQKLTTYALQMYYGQFVATTTGSNYYFGGKLIKNATGYVTPDRLGSIGKYFPYGQERPSATTDGKEKFATYFRDSETGLDYADQRYHQVGMGRFMTPDPAGVGLNWYAYAGGDPVNNSDPSGLDYSALCGNPATHANNPVGAAMVCGGSTFGNIRDPLGGALFGGDVTGCFGMSLLGIGIQSCGGPPPELYPPNQSDIGARQLDACLRAISELLLATENVAERVGEIILDVHGTGLDPTHIKSLAQAITRLENAKDDVKNKCSDLIGPLAAYLATALSAAAAVEELAAPYLALAL